MTGSELSYASQHCVQLDLHDLGHPPQGHPLDQQFQRHEDFVFRATEVVEDGPGPLTERSSALPAQQLANPAPLGTWVGPVGDDISLSPFTEQGALWIRTCFAAEVIRGFSTSLSHHNHLL